jgi:hypothetical protein
MTWTHATTNLPPVMAQITNRTVTPDSGILFRVQASDPNGDELTYSLGAGAPPTATINGTNGLFHWLPTRAYAETTNPITIVVSDDGTPPMSTNQTFTLTVLDYLELDLGATNLQGGQSAQIPIFLSLSDAATNLVLGVKVPESVLTNWSVTAVAPQLASATLLDQTTNIQITLLTTAGQSLQGAQQVATLNFTAVSNNISAFVGLPVSSISALKTNGLTYSNYITPTARVAVVQNQPLLLGTVSGSPGGTLQLFGKVGMNYQLQYRTNLDGASPWAPLLTYSQTNGVMSIQPGVTGPAVYYRLLQQ